MTTRRTKIVCTIGPAVTSKENLRKLALNGMDVARLNFSHGKHSDFEKTIQDLRSIEKEVNRPLGIMADIQGPKIRVTKLEKGSLDLKTGQEVWMTYDGQLEHPPKDSRPIIPTGYKDFVKDISPGFTILLDDGLIGLKVLDKKSYGLLCTVVDSGLLKENKGINVPQASFSAPSITEKDYEDILFCISQGIDFIAMSFVRTAQEVRHLREFIDSRGKKIQVLAKIEKQDALNNLEEIIEASDGVLVARGDLAVEVGNELVPVLQKKIVKLCNLKGKSVIIATQMLMSMVDNPRPTRAEASDVANAIIDGADALMLSNETAVGKYPFEAVKMMVRISEEIEEVTKTTLILHDEWQVDAPYTLAINLMQSAVRLAAVIDASLMAILTSSGQSADRKSVV